MDLENEDASWSGPRSASRDAPSATMAWTTMAARSSARPPKRPAAVKMLLKLAAKNDGHDDGDDDESVYDDESGDEDDYNDAENEPEARPKRRRVAEGDAAPAPHESQKLTRLEKRRAAEAKMPRTDKEIVRGLMRCLAGLETVARVKVAEVYWKYRGAGEGPADAAASTICEMHDAWSVESSVAVGVGRSRAERLVRSHSYKVDEATQAALCVAAETIERSLRADAVKDAITEPDQDIRYSLPLGSGKQPVLKVTGWTRADIAAPALADTKGTLAEEGWSSLVRDDASKPSNLEIISPARITKPDGKVVVCQTMERVALSVNAEDGCTRDQYQSRAEAVTAGFDGMRSVWLAVHKSNRRSVVASISTPSTRRLLHDAAVWVPHRSTYPARPRRCVHPTHWLICAQVVRRHLLAKT